MSGHRLREDEALEWVTAEALSAVSIDAARIGEPEPARRGANPMSDAGPTLGKCTRAPVPEALSADGAAPPDPLLVGLDEADAFELGVRPGAPPLARYRSGDIVVNAVGGPR